jgi:hypothetical protein
VARHVVFCKKMKSRSGCKTPSPAKGATPVPCDINEYARGVASRLMRAKAFLKSRDERKRVGMRFAHLKATTVSNECGVNRSKVNAAPPQPHQLASKR